MSLTAEQLDRLTPEEQRSLVAIARAVADHGTWQLSDMANLVLLVERLVGGKPTTNEHGQLLCPLHLPDDPYSDRELYVVRESYVPLDLTDLQREPKDYPVGMGVDPWPGAPTSTGWRVECVGGHVLAKPGGDSEANEATDYPSSAEWEALRALLDRGPVLLPTWYLATCDTCEPRLPQPFRHLDDRTEWVREHTDANINHTVTLTQEVRS